MKTHTIKTPTAELLIVELPRVCDFDLYQDKIYIYDHEAKEGKSIEGSYTLLGKPDEIREEDARELVQSESLNFGNPFYKNFQNEKQPFRTAKESLLSLLGSEVFWENPYFEPDFFSGDYDDNGYGEVDKYQYKKDLNRFHEAEQKTFNRNISIIFKKVTPKI